MEMQPGLVEKVTCKRVPLNSIDVETVIYGTFASVISKFLYENVSDVAIETVFQFPMDDGAAVFQFEAEIDDRHIIAECQEIDQAQSTYNSAVQDGYGAILAQEHESCADIFTMSVGNLPPKTSATIVLGYVVELPLDRDGGVEFCLPMLLTPRYNPLTQYGMVSQIVESATYTPKEIHYSFDFKATVKNVLPIKDVVSESANISCETDDAGNVSVALKEKFNFKSDFRMKIFYAKTGTPRLVLSKGDPTGSSILKKDMFMASFIPHFSYRIQSKVELIFFVDRSGSMQGERIKQARSTLELFLKSLPMGCMFNVVSFGHTFELLFEESQLYDQKSLKDAVALAKNMGADMGGTDIYQPLEHTYTNIERRKGFLRQMFVITDGCVGNTHAVIELVKQHASHTRVFAVGIGDGCSTSLVKGIARAGKGIAKFISDKERLQAKVISMLELALQPKLTDVQISLNSTKGKITTIPRSIPNVFANEILHVFGLADYEYIPGDTVSMFFSAKQDEKMIEQNEQFTFDTDNTYEASHIHRLMAKSQVKFLEDEEEEVQKCQHKADIVTLSLASNITSHYTAFVGVDFKTKSLEKDIRTIPNNSFSMRAASQAQQGYQGNMFICGPPPAQMIPFTSGNPFAQNAAAIVPQACQVSMSARSESLDSLSASPACHYSHYQPYRTSTDGLKKTYYVKPFISKLADSARGLFNSVTGYFITATIVKDALDILVSEQDIGGNWRLGQYLECLFNTSVKLKDLQKQCPTKDTDIWATVLVVSWLEQYCAAKKDEWILLSMKAEIWLKGKEVDDEVKAKSMDFVKSNGK